MLGLFSRTSVTVDEAVEILLGKVDGPIIFRSTSVHPSPEEEDEIDSLVFSLNDSLEEESDFLESELAEAIYDKLPQSVIDLRRAALKQHRADMALANAYRCAIDNELNKGDASILRIDVKLSAPGYTYITMTSLDKWFANQEYPVRVLVPVPTITQPIVEVTEGKKKLKTRRRLREQEEAIVAEIKRLGHNPLELPAHPKGKPGVKSIVWTALKDNTLFISYNVFDTAWQRARDLKEITEAV